MNRRSKNNHCRSGYAKNKAGTLDKVLVFIGVLLIAFIAIMIYLFCKYQQIPDTLCTCVFAACTGELGFTGMIQATKNRYRDREWEKEDREEKYDEEQEQDDDLQYLG